jgi:hypothetical protein
MPASYARRFAGLIKAPAKIAVIGGAGHLAELDPDAVAAAVLEWME